MKSVSVIGLGKLGACMAAVYASKGFKVVGVDLNQSYVDAINAGQAPVTEPQLAEYLKLGAKNLSATTDAEKAVLETEATFIIVPTPSDLNGEFSTAFVEKACAKIGAALAKKKDYHLITLTSTVLPGASEAKIIAALEKFSGKKCGADFGYCYSPEFIAIGSVIKNLLNPDFFLIGQHDAKAGELLAGFYKQVCDNGAAMEIMSITSAELAKISINAYVTTKITFANMIAEISEHIPGVDANSVLSAMGHDKRIGSNYLKIGLGFGGPCFPRDNVAFARMANNCGCGAPIPETTHAYNEKMVDRIADIVLRNIQPHHKIGFLGIAYKPDTPVVEESHALKIAQKLRSLGRDIFIHEPAGHEHLKKEMPEELLCNNILDCLDNSDAYFLSYPDKQFLEIIKYLEDKSDKVVFDPWGILKGAEFNDSIVYITLGLGK